MKYIIICMIFISTSLFANYAYTGQNSGKIDMHGGKSDNLTGKRGFSSNNFSLGNNTLQKDIKTEETSNLKEEKKELEKTLSK